MSVNAEDVPLNLGELLNWRLLFLCHTIKEMPYKLAHRGTKAR
jgi:hypothetical protein